MTILSWCISGSIAVENRLIILRSRVQIQQDHLTSLKEEITFYVTTIFSCCVNGSTVVEHLTHNPMIEGSNPARPFPIWATTQKEEMSFLLMTSLSWCVRGSTLVEQLTHILMIEVINLSSDLKRGKLSLIIQRSSVQIQRDHLTSLKEEITFYIWQSLVGV